ncbi:MAG: efflux RND transporter periplasmic adaptor subunit, partial [Candidatus Hydrogenedentales bacterium]
MRMQNVVTVLFAASVLSAGAWAAAGPPQGPGGAPPPPPEVTCVVVETKTVPVSFDYVGMTEASKTVEVRARIRGFLDSRDFQEGTFVEAGTKLFTIDPRSYQADQQIAVARVEQAQARLKLAEQDVKRLKSVTVPGAIAESDLDKQVAEEVNAKASLQLAKAELAKAELELSYTVVGAPLTGYIGKAQKEIGSFVDESQSSLLAVMHQVNPLYVSFKVSEREFLSWRNEEQAGTLVLVEGSQPYAEITLLEGTQYDKRGTISFESPDVDIATGTLEFRASFENPENQLKPGQFAKVHLRGWTRPSAITVPQRAVSQSPRGPYVYVVGDDKKAEMRIVTTGEWSGSDWVISDGLKPGERIIVEGLTKVQPGGEVTPLLAGEQPPSAPEQPAPAAEQPAPAAQEQGGSMISRF